MDCVDHLYLKSFEQTSKSIKKSPQQCIEGLCLYLSHFENKHIKDKDIKKYDYCLPLTLKSDETFNSKSELNSYAKYQVSIGLAWFRCLIEKIKDKNKKITSKMLINYGSYIRDFLHDISPLIEHIERKKEPGFVFLNGSKDYSQQTVFVYKDALLAYWNSIDATNKISHRGGLSASCYFLRQSLELKFRRILGFIDATDKQNNSIKIRHEFFPEFIKKNLSHFEMNNVSVDNLLKIYKWTNTTIHTSTIPYIWQLWYIFEYCDKFIYPSSMTLGESWSIHNSVIINNFDLLHEKLCDSICSEYGEGKYLCFHTNTPEAVIKNA